ncbi:auxin efflux carrier superfamily [Grosmannia clavigera kw1407]|uniref:Auxin efflux carrier superfamily n=1 Tax=Grosmannia clavigera (strain kw1407 / UAMH 11150) TaxID=655863 RepID=F0XJ96_GROCL|nr:auxin efflux carrier superfamily [Grosmannia clavigera kw1407]EFX02083.1 auxin efflux carrier superfamily [Grosmannia clavigera kw1407]
MADYIAGVSEMPILATTMNSHDSHPSLGHLTLLVFEAVMEVVCVSLPGYIIARLGHFDADKQKFLANLNVMLFTPCLIFTKLASQLDADKFSELGIIPVIFVVMTIVSYCVSVTVSKLFGFNKRASNFVTAMGVFGNSNSLPISLVLSLSQTLKGLHWDKIPGDNDDEVGARGILYLMIFQQLGQLVRWSWGYHVLLAPKSKYEEYAQATAEEGRYRDSIDSDTAVDGRPTLLINDSTNTGEEDVPDSPTSDTFSFEPSGRTPVAPRSRASISETDADDDDTHSQSQFSTRKRSPRYNGHGLPDGIMSFPRIHSVTDADTPSGMHGLHARLLRRGQKASEDMASRLNTTFESLPPSVQTVLQAIQQIWLRVYNFLWDFMNPPLWAMLIAVVVASFPSLKQLFFAEGSFFKNSVTSAVSQSAGVAVPIILVVLGANLARNTQNPTSNDAEEAQIGKKLLIASLISRMLLPTLIMAPILALFAKYVPISILDDPIFVIVCFLLTGAPSALQLAQICQINGVYEQTMSKVLFQSYVIWILPSTLILVLCALEVVEWAR